MHHVLLLVAAAAACSHSFHTYNCCRQILKVPCLPHAWAHHCASAANWHPVIFVPFAPHTPGLHYGHTPKPCPDPATWQPCVHFICPANMAPETTQMHLIEATTSEAGTPIVPAAQHTAVCSLSCNTSTLRNNPCLANCLNTTAATKGLSTDRRVPPASYTICMHPPTHARSHPLKPLASTTANAPAQQPDLSHQCCTVAVSATGLPGVKTASSHRLQIPLHSTTGVTGWQPKHDSVCWGLNMPFACPKAISSCRT